MFQVYVDGSDQRMLQNTFGGKLPIEQFPFNPKKRYVNYELVRLSLNADDYSLREAIATMSRDGRQFSDRMVIQTIFRSHRWHPTSSDVMGFQLAGDQIGIFTGPGSVDFYLGSLDEMFRFYRKFISVVADPAPRRLRETGAWPSGDDWR